MDGAILQRVPRASGGAQVRFMTAGSVDDGKSTLIGRLLLDSKALLEDQIGDLGDDQDLAFITDGLEAERAQGITIDVAYRYFATPRTSFVIADAPGHEQYTRNMVTAASASDVAVLVVDASRFDGKSLKVQTARHAAIAALMGLKIIVAINKMDVVDWSRQVFDAIRHAFAALSERIGASPIAYVPVSARHGDNVVREGGASWYVGPSLIEVLESVVVRTGIADESLRLPVQVVLRSGGDRFYAGRIESGTVRPRDAVAIGPNGPTTSIRSVYIAGRAVASAQAGASVAVSLSDEHDLGPGNVITEPAVCYSRRVAADLCWLDEAAWTPGRRYKLRQGTLETQALISGIRFARDIATFTPLAVDTLEPNDIARVEVTARDPLLGDLYARLPGTGAFVLFDQDTNQTVAAGMIREVLT